ncbi:hypothetical protein [Methylocaldum gracile]|jgi:LDH2 family malate/lactate/ureidoglycolate dehydrogenase|uniref:hypothetical protein n=1 Tax=unclassified Methylocaldum TaxID=2622260 RepID=UPI0010F3225A
MTLPIANGLAGSAGQPLPEDAVCDWEGFPTYSPESVGRQSLADECGLSGLSDGKRSH